MALSAGAATALAEEGQGHGRRGPAMHRMAEALHLSDEQREQLKRIYRAARGETMKLRDAMRDNRRALRGLDPASPDYLARVKRLAAEKARLVERMELHRAGVRAKVAAILTPEQRRRLKEWRKHRHPRRMRRRGFAPGAEHDGPPPFPPDDAPRIDD